MPRYLVPGAVLLAAVSACNSFKGTTCSCTTASQTVVEIVTDGSCTAVAETNPQFTACTPKSQGDLGPLGPTIEALSGPPDWRSDWGLGIRDWGVSRE